MMYLDPVEDKQLMDAIEVYHKTEYGDVAFKMSREQALEVMARRLLELLVLH